ncbi:MAG: class I SAM-dependent methyltransferase [Burkholderiaceae bacterium]|nr:class I SAM-dependent methyltransferase [Burkholderiaceae bacterium]
MRQTRFADFGATDTVSTSYELLPLLLGPVLVDGDVFVDVGCGRGRVLNWVVEDGRAASVFGLELDKVIAASVARRFTDRLDVTIVAGDALGSLPDAGSVFYMWHPFERPLMARFVETFLRKYRCLGRLNEVRLVYHNCLHADLWESAAGARVTPIELPAGERHKAVLVTFLAE